MSRKSVAQQLKKKFSLGSKSPDDDSNRKLKESNELSRARSPTKSSHLAMYSNIFAEYSLMAEYNNVRKQRIPGVFVVPSQSTPFVWYGFIIVSDGFYDGATLKFEIRIPRNYPDGDCPMVTVNPPIYHPAVDANTGELELQGVFPAWRANVNHLCHVVMYIRKVFTKIDCPRPKNIEAAHTFKTNIESFKQNVCKSIENAHQQLHNPKSDDENSVRFQEWNDEIHNKALADITQENDKDIIRRSYDPLPSNNISHTKLSGLSWLEPGTFLILSKQT